jgi:hypothetical protein
MERGNELEKLLDRSSRKLYLQPNELTEYRVEDGLIVIRLAEHIVVFNGIVQQHGIIWDLRIIAGE